jgi:hypothetical protein
MRKRCLNDKERWQQWSYVIKLGVAGMDDASL